MGRIVCEEIGSKVIVIRSMQVKIGHNNSHTCDHDHIKKQKLLNKKNNIREGDIYLQQNYINKFGLDAL